MIAQLTEAVAARPLTVVVGPSGSGKSSLVHAGLVPALRAKGWTVLPTQRPGSEPLAALAVWAGALGAPTGLADPGAAWLAAVNASRTRSDGLCLVIVDQFEELLTHRTSEQERSGFLGALASALEACPWLHLVVTVRSDAEPQFHATALEPWWSAARFAVPAMSRDELRQIIERPAAATVLYFEPSRLIERLLDDVALVPAPLPLLSFALSELYRRYWMRWQGGGGDRALREIDYEEMGSVARALTQRATAIYDDLVVQEPAYSTTIRNIMFRMVAVIGGEIARRRVPLRELVYEDPAENRRVAEVLQRLNDLRLISLGTDDAGGPAATAAAYAEPSHDELVRGWMKVATWLDELDTPAGTRGLLAALTDAVRFWSNHARSESYLWVDPRADLLKSIGLAHRFVYNADEAQFVAASIQRLRRQRARTIGGLAIAVAALAIIAGIALWQRGRAADNAAEANRQRVMATANADQANRNASEAKRQRDESRRLLAQAFQDTGRQLSLENRYQEAIPYLAAARERGAEGSALRALFWISSRSLPLVAPLEHSGVVWSAAFSPDGTRIVTASDDGAARIWDAGSGALLATLRHHEPALAAAFNRDGARVLTVTGKAEYAWDASSGKLVADPASGSPGKSGAAGAVASVASVEDLHIRNAATSRSLAIPRERATVSRIVMTVDGMRFNDKTADRDVRIWDAGTARRIAALVENPGGVQSVAYSSDGAKIAIAYGNHVVRVWNTAAGKPVSPVLVHGDKISRVALSRDGARVVTAGFDGAARVWDVATGKLVSTVQHQGVVTSAEFDATGERVVTGSYDRTARVWDVASGSPVAPVLQHQGPVWDAVFSPDGTRVVTAGHDHTARIWSITDRPLVSILRHQGTLNGVMFDTNGARVITASEDHTARVWDVATGRPVAYVLRHPGPVNGVAFSPDGTRIVTMDGDTAYVWDAATGKLRTTLRHQPAVKAGPPVGPGDSPTVEAHKRCLQPVSPCPGSAACSTARAGRALRCESARRGRRLGQAAWRAGSRDRCRPEGRYAGGRTDRRPRWRPWPAAAGSRRAIRAGVSPGPRRPAARAR